MDSGTDSTVRRRSSSSSLSACEAEVTDFEFETTCFIHLEAITDQSQVSKSHQGLTCNVHNRYFRNSLFKFLRKILKDYQF